MDDRTDMKLDNVDPDLQHLESVIEGCRDVAKKNQLYFLEYLLGMAQMEMQNIAATAPRKTDQRERQLETT